jgi:uncharacterized protein involved in exopolysaccharide biosynthesis
VQAALGAAGRTHKEGGVLMGQSEHAGWQPETDVDYGQRLAGFLLWMHRWWLLGGVMLGGAAVFIISLCVLPSYHADASLIVDKQSTSAALPTGMFATLTGANTALEDEKQVLVSREIAKPVMDELGLRIRIVDSASPDAPLQRLLKYVRLYRGPKRSREELYSKLTLKDVRVSPELLNKADYVLRTSRDGTWRIGDRKGKVGDRVELREVGFTPVFGTAHVPGQCYMLEILPGSMAYVEFSKHLDVSVINSNADVLRVSYRYHNPFVCKQVVEQVVSRYLQRYREKSTQDYDEILDYINAETVNVRKRADELTAELTAYREQHKAYVPDAQGQAAIERISALMAALTQLRVQEKTVETALSTFDFKTPEQVYDLVRAPASGLSIESSLMQNLAELINELEQQKLRKTEAHPDVQRLRSSINTTIGQMKNSLRTGLEQLRTQVSALNSDLGEMKASLQGLPEAEGRVALMLAELDANAAIDKVLATSEAQTRLKRASTTTDVSPLDQPVVPEKPDSPRPLLNGAIGAVAGLVLAILLSLILEASDPRIRTLREIRLGIGLPVLAVVPGPPLRGRRWRPVQRAPELLRRLAQFLRCKGRCIGLVHPLGAGGGFDLAWGLAEATAGPGKPTLLVDGDRMADGLAAALDKPAIAGLAEIAAGLAEASAVAVLLSEDRRLLSLGQAALEQEPTKAALGQLLEVYSTVLLCLPSPLRWSDQAAVAGALDAVYLVIPQHGVNREDLAQVLLQLTEHGIKVQGAIVTNYAPRHDVLGRRELRHVAVSLEGAP